MTPLSSAAWIAHDVGLAATIGGGLFGQLAMEPSLDVISNAEERDRLSARAWNKYSWVKLAGHAAFAVPWLVGRTMMSGKEVSSGARALTLAKDALVIASVISGVTSFALGRALGNRSMRGQGPDRQREQGVGDRPASPTLEKAVAAVGMINTITTAGVLGVTSLLAMAGSKSRRFSWRSRRLP